MRLSKSYLKVGNVNITSKLISLDFTKTNESSRSNWNRAGSFINESIDSIEVNFKRDDIPEFLDLGPQSQIMLTYSDGARRVTGPFIVETKINTKDVNGVTNTFISFIPQLTTKDIDGKTIDTIFKVEAEVTGGGTVTPEMLHDLIIGEGDIGADLTEDESQLRIFPHYKKVKLDAPVGATSGTVTDEDIAALEESENSYIVLNSEKYYLMDNQHTPGSLGYSHLGYENNKFVEKNITITLSTKSWVLSQGGSSEEPFYKVTVEEVAPDTYEVTSPNYFNEIKDYYLASGKYPRIVCENKVYGEMLLELNSSSVIEADSDTIPLAFSLTGKERPDDPAFNLSINVIVTADDQQVQFNQWTDEPSGGAPTYAIEVVFNDPELTSYSVVSSNYAEEIKQYIENNSGKLPNIQMRLGIDGRNNDINAVKITYDDVFMFITTYVVDYDRDVPQEIQVTVRCEFGHSGSSDGQEVFPSFANRPAPLSIKVTDNDTIDGITVPKINLVELDQAFNAFDNNRQVIIYWASHPSNEGVHKYLVDCIYDEAHQRSVAFSLENGVYVIENSSGGITVRRNQYTVQTFEPVEDNTDGMLHIVKLDAEPANYYNGYIYLIKE